MQLRLQSIFLASFFGFLFPNSALACDCEPLALVHEALTASTHVFSGKVIKQKEYKAPGVHQSYSERKYTFLIDKLWKGPKQKQITVRFPVKTEHCGLELALGKSYLVYAIGNPVPLSDACSRSIALDNKASKYDLRKLGKFTKIADPE